MAETGTEQYKSERQLAHFRKWINFSKNTDEFENLKPPLQKRLQGLIKLEAGEKLMIVSMYLDNWLLLSSKRLFYGTDDICLFALNYPDILDCGWFVGDEIPSLKYMDDGVPLKASPKLKILSKDGIKRTMLLEPGEIHNTIWNNIRLRMRLESIHKASSN